MNQPTNKKVIPVLITNYPHPPTESVYQVQDDPIVVAPGETVEILMSDSEGFSVYVPVAGHFDSQVYEAVENPTWGPGAGTWGVRMTRISKAGAYTSGDSFPYCIYSKKHYNFAMGLHSPPKMNLDP